MKISNIYLLLTNANREIEFTGTEQIQNPVPYLLICVNIQTSVII